MGVLSSVTAAAKMAPGERSALASRDRTVKGRGERPPALRRPLRVAFVHPDLGIGGAERLVIDAALALRARGHAVTVFTAHRDPARCFPEARDGTLPIRVHGSFLPFQIGGRMRAPCTIARMAWLAGAVGLCGGPLDAIFCDVAAHAIPLIRLASPAKVLFYCHFPDRLLAPRRGGWYKLYRAPIDRLEAIAMGLADRVLVNSRFTAETVRRAFPRLRRAPGVLYPAVDLAAYAAVPAAPAPHEGEPLLLSIARYERKKGLGLAIEALARLADRRARLVIAGGYDERLDENRETLAALEALALRLGVADRVAFRRSCTDEERIALLARSIAVLYTPKEEHFGLVPIEAMAAGRPVIAVKSGGPLETIVDGETGILCEPTPEAFAAAISALILDPAKRERMGSAGRAHVRAHFGREKFGERLEEVLYDLFRKPERARVRSGNPPQPSEGGGWSARGDRHP
jgi:alpha-1,3/alpha-1,6-mannosyltransferase